MYRFERYCQEKKWYWRLWSPFNRIIAVSATGYSSSALCKGAIAIIKDNLAQDNFEIFRDDDRYGTSEIWQWRFGSPQNGVMAISSMGYSSYALCERAIGIFLEKAQFAQITTRMCDFV